MKVAFCADFSSGNFIDPGFGMPIVWDNLEFNFDHVFLRNYAIRENPNSFFGLINPSIVSVIMAEKPSHVVFFGYRNFTFLLALLLCRIMSIRTVIRGDSHTLDNESIGRFRGRIKQFGLRVIFKFFDYAFPTGISSTAYFSQAGIPRDRLFVIEHFVDEKFFDGGRMPTVVESESRRKLFFVGKLEEKKSPGDILKAAELLERTHQDFVVNNLEIHFVGSGELLSSLKKQADLISVHTIFHGFKNQSEVRDLLLEADFLVLPSIRNETWGLVVNEAMLSSTAVIVSNKVGCAPDLVRDGKTGFVVDAGNVQDLADRILQLVKMSADELLELKDNARSLALKYTVSAAVRKWRVFFDI